MARGPDLRPSPCAGEGDRRPSAPESRALMWLAFARACVSSQPLPFTEASSAAFAAAAGALAAHRPFTVSLDAFKCQVSIIRILH